MTRTADLALLYSYVREAPRTYVRVVVLSVFVGVLEFVGITSVLPAMAILLAEPVQGTPEWLLNLVNNTSPALILAGYVAVVLIQGGVAFLNESLFLKSMIQRRTQLALDYVSGIINAPFEAFAQLNPGEVETTIARNLGYAIKIRYRTAEFISDCVLSVFYVAISLYIAYESVFLFVLLALSAFVISRLTVHVKIRHAQICKDQHLLAAKDVSEYLSDIRGLLVSDKSVFLERVGRTLVKAARSERTYTQVDVLLKSIHQPLMLVLIAIGVVSSKVLFQISNSSILVMLFVFYRAAPKLMAVAKGYGDILGDSPADVTPEVERWQALGRTRQKGTLTPAERCDVRFQHATLSHGSTPIVSDASLTIPAGAFAVFIGKSGAGKSTLLDAICGFKTPESGTLTIGGINSCSIDYDRWLLSDVAIVRQESIIVSGDIAGNIAFLARQVDAPWATRLLSMTGVDEFLTDRDLLSATIQAKGENLSAGQRQRIILARALYKKPKLLLLDEPTSNLDRKTEEDILKLLASLKGQMTIVATSHRGGMLALADAVYEVRDQRVEPIEVAELLGQWN